MTTLLKVLSLTRRLSPWDKVLSECGRALQVLSGSAIATRPYPASAPHAVENLSAEQKQLSARLMRVNHVGEICAQALYRGQALVCDKVKTRTLLHQAAAEEVDHLIWCHTRIKELQNRPSLLNPVWYAGAFITGAIAGYGSATRNLGFMAETERQVEVHLEGHLERIPLKDIRSRLIIEQMKKDEIQHRLTAQAAGGVRLTLPVRWMMQAMSKVMTNTAYWI